MTYYGVGPGYYAVNQPETIFGQGSKGWSRAPVPNWGESRSTAFPKRLAISGGSLGAAASVTQPDPNAPFFRQATVPFASYVRAGVAPWGWQKHGPATAAPREGFCSECQGARTLQPYSLGGGCPKCTIPGIGDQCLPCDGDTAGQPECEGCTGAEEDEAPAPRRRGGGGGGRARRGGGNVSVQTLAPAAAAHQAAAVTVAAAAPAPAAPPSAPAAPAATTTPRLGAVFGVALIVGITSALVYRAAT